MGDDSDGGQADSVHHLEIERVAEERSDHFRLDHVQHYPYGAAALHPLAQRPHAPGRHAPRGEDEMVKPSPRTDGPWQGIGIKLLDKLGQPTRMPERVGKKNGLVNSGLRLRKPAEYDLSGG